MKAYMRLQGKYVLEWVVFQKAMENFEDPML